MVVWDSIGGIALVEYFPASNLSDAHYLVQDHLSSNHTLTDDTGPKATSLLEGQRMISIDMKSRRLGTHKEWSVHMKISRGILFQFSASFLLPLLATAATEKHGMNEFVKPECDFEKFVELDSTDRSVLIASCPPEDQVILFLAWSIYTVPSNLGYAGEIAKTGEPLIPILISLLEKNDHLEDDINKPKVLIVMEVMNRKGYYEIAKNPALMSRIESAISKVHDESTKDWLHEIFSEIQDCIN